MSCGLKSSSTSFHVSYCEAGRKLYGAPRCSARSDASAATRNAGFGLLLSTIGSPLREPSRLKRTRTWTTMSATSSEPAGISQNDSTRARNAPIQLCIKNCELAFGAPSDAGLTIVLVTVWRCDSRLSSKASLLSILASRLGSGFLGCGCGFGGAGFFSAFLSASAISSVFGSGFLASAAFGLGGGGGGVASLEAGRTSVLLPPPLAACSGACLASPPLSAIGLGVSAFAAVLIPAVSFESCVSEMMSTGIESSSLILSGAAE